MAILYGPSYSGIYAKEIKNIREEQKIQEGLIEKKELEELEEKEKQKMIGGGFMQIGASLGKGAKKFASTKLKEAARFDIGGGVMSEPIQKFETVAGKTPELFDRMGSFGDVGKTAWDTFEDYTGMSFGGEATQLTSEYITKGIESGAGVSELGIGEITAESLFTKTSTGSTGAKITQMGGVGAEEAIMATVGKGDAARQVQVGTATLTKAADATAGTAAEFTTKLSEAGIKDAAAGSATASAGSIAGTAAAGLGIATGAYQAFTGEDDQTKIAGGLKAVGSGLMLSGVGAPVGLAMTGLGTLLDFF